MPLHPVIAAVLAKFKEVGRPDVSACTPEEARALVASGRAALGEAPPVGTVSEIEIPTRAGRIPGRLIRPTGAPIGLVVYLHGGGWVIGERDDFDVVARTLAALSGAAVLLVDYRLAPEHPYPAGLEDVEDALVYADREKVHLAGGPVPLVVAGDSAGGNLATVAARRLRGRVELALQALIYPVTDHDTVTESYRAYGTDCGITRADMLWFFGHYAPAERLAEPDISPLRASDLAGLPPAFVMTAEYDVLRDEGEAYAKRLSEAGVRTELKRYEGLNHGFIRLHNLVDTAKVAVEDLAERIRAACGVR